MHFQLAQDDAVDLFRDICYRWRRPVGPALSSLFSRHREREFTTRSMLGFNSTRRSRHGDGVKSVRFPGRGALRTWARRCTTASGIRGLRPVRSRDDGPQPFKLGNYSMDDTRLWSDQYMQPILFAVQMPPRRLQGGGIRPSRLAGHSLGEYAAACLAGCLEPEAAISCTAAAS